ncbi:MAG: hypothetical protein GX942_09315, partial [Papillibacter sp.]|nr:hypothetical protein [Papillibacter sp.]
MKKLISLLVLLTLTVGLFSACGSVNKGNEADKTPASTEQLAPAPTDEPTPAPTETPEEAVTFRIGGLTG